jgi:hypothetical protein
MSKGSAWSAQHKKTPISSAWGQDVLLTPSPRKVSSVNKSAGSWLAAVPYSLRLGATASAQGEALGATVWAQGRKALPKVRGLSGLRRFRSAYSCGAALVSHQLPWSQAAPVTR